MPAEVAALVLAAGRATRFGAGADTSKVYASLEGRALVAHVVALARASRASPVIVVTGHAAHRAAAALEDEPPDRIVGNPDYATGLASSLQAGIAALPTACTAVLVLLADMPLVATATLDALIDRFRAEPCDAVVPSVAGSPGNPVLLGRALFDEVRRLAGDEGARKLLKQPGRKVLDCPVDDPGILADVDTPEALLRLRRR